MKEILLFENGLSDDYELDEIWFEDIMHEIAAKFEPCFLVGTVGRWNGTFDGYKYIDSVQSLRHAVAGYDNIKLVQVGTRLHFNLHHHDGAHHMELRRLTDYGYENSHKYSLDSYSPATFDFIRRYTKNFGKVG